MPLHRGESLADKEEIKKKVIKRIMLHVCKCVCLFVSNAEIVIGFQFGRIEKFFFAIPGPGECWS